MADSDFMALIMIFDTILSLISKEIIGYFTLSICFISLFHLLSSRNFSSSPTKWAILFHNGKVQRIGKNLKGFLFLNEKFIEFDDVREKVEFNVSAITKELQGIRVIGYLYWSVTRDHEYLYKYYQTTQGNRGS